MGQGALGRSDPGSRRTNSDSDFARDGLAERTAIPELSPGAQLGLTDYLGGCKLEMEHPTGGHHAKRTKDLYTRVQTGDGAISAKEWEIASPSCTRPRHCGQHPAPLV